MHIAHVEIANFRKLVATRIAFTPEKTVFVGANNSGKTSAMTALRRFLVDPRGFTINDFSLVHGHALIAEGQAWEAALRSDETLPAPNLLNFLPQLDVWLQVGVGEMHYVQKLIPTLDWQDGLLGVRLCYEPDDRIKFQREYIAFRRKATETMSLVADRQAVARKEDLPQLELWPRDLIDFLERRMRSFFRVKAYLLDPAKQYDNHLDWQDTPELSDVKAIEALDKARRAFDDRLSASFKNALDELQTLGYPGISDPTLKIATKLKLQDGLSHDSAVQYEIPDAAGRHVYRLPEDTNGLGYQNLVSIIFGLMSYRDGWMRAGKAAASGQATKPPAPLHLMLLEEPEAYLHVQVQQVFIKHAYNVLRNAPELGQSTRFRTQLVVSTHSSHVAYACNFATLRYFRRLPPIQERNTPTACVIDLSSVFGTTEQQTAKFVARYLKATHCDLFFADAAIFIEGNAERILVPHFVEQDNAFEYLRSCYITWLEVGGSHAHRFKSLVETLGLTTLIITDLDAIDPAKKGERRSAALAKHLEFNNQTLREWVPKLKSIDELIALQETQKQTCDTSKGYAVRAAYQTGVTLPIDSVKQSVYANTFEDALFYKNHAFFNNDASEANAKGLARQFQHIANNGQKANTLNTPESQVAELQQQVAEAIQKGDKAKFALDLLFSEDVENLSAPDYIREGLLWLQEQLKRKETDLTAKVGAA